MRFEKRQMDILYLVGDDGLDKAVYCCECGFHTCCKYEGPPDLDLQEAMFNYLSDGRPDAEIDLEDGCKPCEDQRYIVGVKVKEVGGSFTYGDQEILAQSEKHALAIADDDQDVVMVYDCRAGRIGDFNYQE